MSNDIKDFLDQTKVDVDAIAGINRTVISYAFDIELLTRIPRFPCAVLADAGGELDEFNGQIWRRFLDITIVVNIPRDSFGEEATRELLDLGDLLTAALEHNTTDTVFLAADSDSESIATESGVILLSKTYRFSYMLDRSS